MTWKTKLENFEREKNWEAAVKTVEDFILAEPFNVEANIRIIYLLHNIILEENCTASERSLYTELLKKYFEDSLKLFCENSEYLFFIGKILHIAEWYFDQDDTSLAFKMEQKALEKEPDNILFQWANALSFGDIKNEQLLAKRIINGEAEKVEWLNERGFPGAYILNFLKYSADRPGKDI